MHQMPKKRKMQTPIARLARWSIYLQAYEFDIVHRVGRLHSNVIFKPVLNLNYLEYYQIDTDVDSVEKNQAIFEYETLFILFQVR